MKILLLNQCFWPDVVATSQQLTAVARGLRGAGHEVTVIASRHGYDNPGLSFASHERWDQIDIHRVRALQLGKKGRWRRALNFASFFLACAGRLVMTPRQDVVVVLTSPPLISWLGGLFTRLRGGQLIFWVMDLNPDEAIAAGWLKPGSLPATLLTKLLHSSMDQAARIVVLDRFMKERIVAKGISEDKVEVIPPARDPSMHYDPKGREGFRRRHNLGEKFVVMYAGNHSPCNPLDTLLDAAKLLKDRDDIIFLFVGGGSELDKVKESAALLQNIRWLPYQPQAALPAALSAADLHVAIMGDAFCGIIHPSKIYNILAIGSPFIFIGPRDSHVGDLINSQEIGPTGVHVDHGQPQKVARLIVQAAAAGCAPERAPRLPLATAPGAGESPQMVALIESALATKAPAFGIEPSARPSTSRI